MRNSTRRSGRCLEQHNARRFQRLPYSRRELFEQIEQHTLAPLPAHPLPAAADPGE